MARANAARKTQTAPRPQRLHPRAVPRRVPATKTTGALPKKRLTPTVGQRFRALPDSRVINGLLTSRLWIWMIGIGLGGIVTMQVSLLKLNAGISRAVETSATVSRQNSALEADIAKLSAHDRVQELAMRVGMVMPAAGAVRYLRARPDVDAERAAQMIGPPNPKAPIAATSPSTLAPTPTQAGAPTVTAPQTTTGATTSPTTPAAPPAAVRPTVPAPTQTAPAQRQTSPSPVAPTSPGARTQVRTPQGGQR